MIDTVKIKTFYDLIAWQKAKLLCVEIYKSTRTIDDRGFNSQIQRASVSVMNNIAEGFERRSNKEFVQFLYIAKGSCGEVLSMIELSVDLGYIGEEDADKLRDLSKETGRILGGLIASL